VPAASAAPALVVERSTWLTEPTGVAQTTDGAYWVADGMMGICRVDAGSLVEDPYCVDGHVATRIGPAKPMGLAFDPATSSFYSGDLQSNQGAVWRLHWDAASGRIDDADQLVTVGGDRVTAVGLEHVADGVPARVLYATKESTAVMRVDDPTAAVRRPVTAGFTSSAGVHSLAALDGHVYAATGSDVERFSVTGRLGLRAVVVPGTAGLAATALAADRVHGRVYAGTTFSGLADDLVALEPATNTVETYERGFAGVSGLGVDSDGAVLLGDDPGVAAAGLDSAFQGRLWRVPFHGLGLSRVSIVSAPLAWGSTSDVAFGYASSGAATFECRLDGASWSSCDGVGEGSVAYAGLAPGRHTFEVRAVTDLGPGVAARRVFVIDRTAPTVTVTAPLADGTVPRGGGRIDMAADETLVVYECAIDDAAPAPCEPGEALPALPLGEHTLQVTAQDAAGNRGAPETVRFTVVDPPPPPPQPEPEPVGESAPPVQPRETPVPYEAPAASAAAPGPAVQGYVARIPPRAPGARLVPTTVVRSRGRMTLQIELGVPASARFARVAIAQGTKSGRTPFVVRKVPVVPGAHNRLAIELSPAQSRRLRPGRYRVTVALTGGPQVLRLTVVGR
jgi:hypothetical protein